MTPWSGLTPLRRHFLGCSMVKQLWFKWHNSESHKVSICQDHCWICRIWVNPYHCAAMCSPHLDVIQDFPVLKNITGIHIWFSLINKVSFASTKQILPFGELFRSDSRFLWTYHLKRLFKESKFIIISEIQNGIEIFEKTKPTCHQLEQNMVSDFGYSKNIAHATSPNFSAVSLDGRLPWLGAAFPQEQNSAIAQWRAKHLQLWMHWIKPATLPLDATIWL